MNTHRLLAAGLVMLAGCSGGGSAAVCAPVERIVEAGNIHVLPGTEVTYEASPPTSGPHQIPAPEPGVYAEPIAEPLQVAMVESGYVLVQYGSSVDAAAVTALEALATSQDDVAVAPGVRPFDDEAAVAFTAWSKRQLCTATDVDAAQMFIDEHVGVFFTEHG